MSTAFPRIRRRPAWLLALCAASLAAALSCLVHAATPAASAAMSPSESAAAKAAVTATAAAAAIGKESDWPLTIKSGDTTLTVYPFQLDAWKDDTLTGRAAVRAVVGKDQSATTNYGVVTATARALSDKGRRVVTLDRVDVDKLEFPAVPQQEVDRIKGIIDSDFEHRTRTIALDRLEAALAIAAEAQRTEAIPLRNDPPHLLFTEKPGLLIAVDGEPAWRRISGSSLERAINTRAMLVRTPDGRLFVHVFDGWMGAATLEGPWSVVSGTPELDRAFKDATTTRLVDPLSGQSTPDQAPPSLKKQVPAVFVATRPSELIVFNGQPNYVPVNGTTLQYVDNTTGHVFRDTADNQVYVLVSGRWFRAADLTGPWTYVAADRLPADFGRIPDDSPKENVKASIAGTAQAREAAIAARVPQTAIVKISGTQLTTPKFDGSPVRRPIPPTALQYVANTATPIVVVGDQEYYALENGVWFTAHSVYGPWAVATSVPASIYTIPPSSPVFYVTFARIYRVDGDNLYVGYTPGYQGTMVDAATGVVVYGTGYSYDPWIGEVWYGAPYTYGFGAATTYTPWTGWAVAYGFGWAWTDEESAAGWGWGAYPWWGPWGWGWAWGPYYYPWYPAWGGVAYGPRGGAIAWGPGGWAGYSGNIYTNWGNRATVSRVGGGYNAWTGNAWATRVGTSYNSRTGIVSAGQRSAVQNVYTGNYAYGGRGVAVGPNGGAVAGGKVTVGNSGTGNEATARRGAAYNPNTGEVTTFGSIHGDQGTIARVGDDVYAGHDGNVYRRTESGWEQHTPGGGWAPVGGTGQDPNRNLGGERVQQLDRDRAARTQGAQRSQALRASSMNMNRSFRGGGGFRGRR